MKCTLYVSDNRVGCPRRGDIDVDVCMTCPDLVDVRSHGDETYIVCRPAFRPLSSMPYGPF